MGERIMTEILEFVAALLFSAGFVVVAWGIILFNMDEQKMYEARQDYRKMNDNLKEADRNDSSRLG